MSTNQEPDLVERQWVEQARQGNLPAFNAIVERYQQLAYNLALRMLRDPSAAEDVTQEAFFSAYRAIARFRGGSLRAWLLTIVANGCRDQLRSPHRRRTVSLEALTDSGNPRPSWPAAHSWAAEELTPEEHAISQELSSQVQAALFQLPHDQRLVVALVDLQGLSYDEASTVTGVSLGTVKSRLSRGRDRLRHLLRPLLELSG